MEIIKVEYTPGEAHDLCEILTREIEGHHNRLETAVLHDDMQFARECAVSADKVRHLRTQVNKALRTAASQGDGASDEVTS